MRSKEEAHDYRYFPDPDLLPLELDEAFVEECKASLPELPDAKRKRYEGLGITPYNAAQLTAEIETARRFEASLAKVVEKSGKSEAEMANTMANWMLSKAQGVLNTLNISDNQSSIATIFTSEDALVSANSSIVAMTTTNVISVSQAPQVYEI